MADLHHTGFNNDQFKTNNPGTWESPGIKNTRNKFPVMTGRIFDRGATLYSVAVDDELLKSMEGIDNFKPNVDKLGSLVRFRVELKGGFPLADSSFGSGLAILYHLYGAAGQRNLARTLLGLCHRIQRNFITRFSQNPNKVNYDVRDDFVRQSLKCISK